MYQGIFLATVLAILMVAVAVIAWQLCVYVTAYVTAVNTAQKHPTPQTFDPEIYGTPGYISSRHASSTRISRPPRTPALASPEEVVSIEQIETAPTHFAPAQCGPRSGATNLTMLGMEAPMPPTRNPRLPAPPPRRGTQLGMPRPQEPQQAPRIAKLTPPSAEPQRPASKAPSSPPPPPSRRTQLGMGVPTPLHRGTQLGMGAPAKPQQAQRTTQAPPPASTAPAPMTTAAPIRQTFFKKLLSSRSTVQGLASPPIAPAPLPKSAHPTREELRQGLVTEHGRWHVVTTGQIHTEDRTNGVRLVGRDGPVYSTGLIERLVANGYKPIVIVEPRHSCLTWWESYLMGPGHAVRLASIKAKDDEERLIKAWKKAAALVGVAPPSAPTSWTDIRDTLAFFAGYGEEGVQVFNLTYDPKSRAA